MNAMIDCGNDSFKISCLQSFQVGLMAITEALFFFKFVFLSLKRCNCPSPASALSPAAIDACTVTRAKVTL